MNKEESLTSLTLAFVITQSFIINEGAFVTSYFSYQVKQSVWTYTDIDTNMYLKKILLQIRCVVLFVCLVFCLFVCFVLFFVGFFI